jgi:hypothetical protein
MSERAQLDHALIDVDILHKPKVKGMRHKFGKLSQLAYLEVLFQLSRATNAEIEIDTVYAVAADNDIEDPDAWIAYMVERGLLSRSGDIISQERVVKDQESLYQSRERWKKSKRAHEDSTRIPRGTPEDEALKSEEVRDEDLNTECISSSLKIVKKLSSSTPESVDAVQRWADHRHKLKLPFDEQAADAVFMSYSGRETELIANILYSISNNYRTICIAPKPQGNAPPRKETNFDRSLKNILAG